MNFIRKLSKIWNYGIAKTVAACFAAHTSSLIVGLSQGYSAILIPQLMDEGLNDTPMDNEEASWAASLGVISNPLGALVAGFLSEILGRKRTVQCCTLPFITGWLTIALSSHIHTLYVGRFITGLAVGMISTTYTYIAEISPAKHRGILSAFGPVVTSFGVVLIYILGYFLHWKTAALISIIISATTFIVMELVPESPPWLVSKNKIERALNSLIWLRGNLVVAENDLKDLLNKNESVEYETHARDSISTEIVPIDNAWNENVQNVLQDFCKRTQQVVESEHEQPVCKNCKCLISFKEPVPNIDNKSKLSVEIRNEENERVSKNGETHENSSTDCDNINLGKENISVPGKDSPNTPEVPTNSFQSTDFESTSISQITLQDNIDSKACKEDILDPTKLTIEKYTQANQSIYCQKCVPVTIESLGLYSKSDLKQFSTKTKDSYPYFITLPMHSTPKCSHFTPKDIAKEKPTHIICSSKTYKPFLILIVFFLFQELSGIYIILFYCVNFLHSLGSDFNDYIGTIIVGAIRFAASIIGAILIRKYPRKMLAMTSGLGMASSLIICGLYSKYYEIYPENVRMYPWIPLVCILGSVCFSMCGFLQLPYVMNSELFPLKIRGIMSGIVLSLANFFIFLSVKLYPSLLSLLNLSGMLLLFGCASLLGAVYCILFLPETQNKSLSEIEASFESKKRKRINAYDNRGFIAD